MIEDCPRTVSLGGRLGPRTSLACLDGAVFAATAFAADA